MNAGPWLTIKLVPRETNVPRVHAAVSQPDVALLGVLIVHERRSLVNDKVGAKRDERGPGARGRQIRGARRVCITTKVMIAGQEHLREGFLRVNTDEVDRKN